MLENNKLYIIKFVNDVGKITFFVLNKEDNTNKTIDCYNVLTCEGLQKLLFDHADLTANFDDELYMGYEHFNIVEIK